MITPQSVLEQYINLGWNEQAIVREIIAEMGERPPVFDHAFRAWLSLMPGRNADAAPPL